MNCMFVKSNQAFFVKRYLIEYLENVSYLVKKSRNLIRYETILQNRSVTI